MAGSENSKLQCSWNGEKYIGYQARPMGIKWSQGESVCYAQAFRFILSNGKLFWIGIWPCQNISLLTPSCESTGITTNCWTTIERKTLELTKKDTPHPKTKEKLQWDSKRDPITIKSNPITGGWMNHRLVNTYHRSPPTGVKVLSPKSGFPTWGSGNGRRNS